jgi:hypothetical protein
MATNHQKPGHGTDRWAKTWTINDTHSDALSNVLLVKNGISRFAVVPAKINNELVGYEVKYTAGEMTDHWQQTILFIRGADQIGVRHRTSSIRCRWRPGRKGNPRDYFEVAHAEQPRGWTADSGLLAPQHYCHQSEAANTDVGRRA